MLKGVPNAESPMDETLEPGVVLVRGGGAGFAQEIRAGRHRFIADEPVADGGTDTGPGPYELILGALGACTSMTIALYARRKRWPLDEVVVRLRHSRVHAKDCADCETKEVMLTVIDSEISLSGALSQEQRGKLRDIAERCPVHRTLTSEIKIRTRLV
jgi:putative redox protein